MFCLSLFGCFFKALVATYHSNCTEIWNIQVQKPSYSFLRNPTLTGTYWLLSDEKPLPVWLTQVTPAVRLKASSSRIQQVASAVLSEASSCMTHTSSLSCPIRSLLQLEPNRWPQLSYWKPSPTGPTQSASDASQKFPQGSINQTFRKPSFSSRSMILWILYPFVNVTLGFSKS